MHFDQFLKEACPPLDLNWRKYRRRAARHRVLQRMAELGLPDFETFLGRLRDDPVEAAGLADVMRITVSRFFRERDCWEALGKNVLPRLLEEIDGVRALRIWSAGCCGGEEPYTLALIWLADFQATGSDRGVEILATDIDQAGLDRARQGCYGPGSVREVPDPLRRRYFHEEYNHLCLTDQVKSMVRFKLLDLSQPPPTGEFDLISCRYLVFTYYRGSRLSDAAKRLRRSLRPGGALMIGRKETLGPAAELFAPWPKAEGLFRKTGKE